jgi:putative DNA primase/helicase
MQLGLLSGTALTGKDVPCPSCGGTDRFRFSDKGFGRWHCRGCGGGDGVKLVMRVKGAAFPEAAKLIQSVVGKGASTPRAHDGDGKARDPLRSWREAAPSIRNTAAETYLKGRGLTLTDAEARSLRFHPALWHWPTQTKWPAMVALVRLADGAELTSHQTFLEYDGSGKAPVGAKTRLFASCKTIAGGGVWFGEADGRTEFIVAEGLESALSAMRLYGAAAGCAALSEGGIRRLILAREARRVRIFADHDELGQGVAAAQEARRRWRAEGREVVVSRATEIGFDANDVLMARSREERAYG